MREIKNFFIDRYYNLRCLFGKHYTVYDTDNKGFCMLCFRGMK